MSLLCTWIGIYENIEKNYNFIIHLKEIIFIQIYLDEFSSLKWGKMALFMILKFNCNKEITSKYTEWLATLFFLLVENRHSPHIWFPFLPISLYYPKQIAHPTFSSPCGKKFRSKKDVAKWAEKTGQSVDLDTFVFGHNPAKVGSPGKLVVAQPRPRAPRSSLGSVKKTLSTVDASSPSLPSTEGELDSESVLSPPKKRKIIGPKTKLGERLARI